MEQCNLGQSNVKVPTIGVGTMLWIPNKNLSEEDLFKTYQACIDNGMDFFDTAEIYGNGMSEKLLGRFQKQDGRNIKIATKFAPPSKMNPMTQKRNKYDKEDPHALLEALDKSLERLGVDCIDLYQIHMPPNNGRIADYMDCMAEAYKQGKIKAIGVCNFGKEQILEARNALAKHGLPLATAMVGYNVIRRYPEYNGVFEICKDLGITVIPYAPLAEGVLTGKYRNGTKVPLSYAVTTYFGHLDLTKERNDNVPFIKKLFSKPREINVKRMEPVMITMEQIAAAHNKSIAQTALNWLITTPDVHVLPIPGIKSVKQANDNAGAANFRITQDERNKICLAEEKNR